MPSREELLRRQKALGVFGDFVLDHEEIEEILNEGCRIVADALGADLAKVMEIERPNDTALVRAGTGWKPGIVGKERISLSERSSEAFAIEQGEPVITNDIARETRFHFPEFLKDHGVVALVNVPIFLPGRQPWGVLQVDAREPRDFEQEDIEFLKTYAMVLGPVVDRLQHVRGRKESDQRYRTLFESIDEGFCIVDRIAGPVIDFRYAAVNPAFERQTGVADAVGRTMREIYPEVKECNLERYVRVADSGASETFTSFAFEREYHVEAFATGRPGQVAMLFRDITLAKQAERTLRESQQRQAFLLRFTDAIRSEPNEQAIIERAVQMLAEELAVDRAYATRHRPAENLTNVVYEVRTPGLAPLPATLRFSDFPEAGRQTFHQTLIFEDTANDPSLTEADKVSLASMGVGAFLSRPLRRQGSPIFALGVVSVRPRRWTPTDVSLVEEAAERTWEAVERTRTEAALRASEAKYRTLFETMGQGYAELELIRDADGRAVDYRYLALNPAYERLTGGLAVADAVGRPARESLPDLEPWWVETYDRIAKRGEPERFEHQVASLNRWYEVFVYSRGGDRLSVLYDEISDRKRAELALRESEERQRFLLAIGDAMRTEATAARKIEIAARLLGEKLGASRVLWGEYDWDKKLAYIFNGWFADGAQPFPTVMELGGYEGQVLSDLKSGRTVRIDDVGLRVSEPGYAAIRDVGVLALLSEPLIVNGRLKVNVSIHQHQPRHWTDDEVDLVREVSERLWAEVVRARAEEALRESEEKYAALFAASPAPFLVLRPDAPHFTIADVNDAYLAATMRTRESLLGRDMFDAFPDNPDDRTANGVSNLRASFERALVSRRFELMDVQKYDIVRPDGTFEERWWKPANAPVVDLDANVVAIIHHVADVTAEHRAVEALRESEEQLRLIVENARDYAIFTQDLDGIVTDWRKGAEKVFGFSREDILGRSADILFTPADIAAREPIKEREQAARTGTAPNVRWHVRKDRSRVFIEGVCTALHDGDGELTGYLKVGRDATDRHTAEERQKILLAELQHRVRNVLAMVRSVVRRTSVNKGDVANFVQHLEGRIDAMARTQAMLTRAPAKAIDLEDLIRDELVAQSAEALRYKIKGPPVALPPKAAELLTLAIHELATNSVKYGVLGQDAGRVSISWEIDVSQRPPRLRFTWRENGLRDAETDRHGFGTELISRRVPYELGGRGEMVFGEGDLTATIEFPLNEHESMLDPGSNHGGEQ